MNSVSTAQRFGALSEEKAKLLRLLLEERSTRTNEISPFPRGESTGKIRVPTSWSQQRLWFIDQLEGGCAAYHMSFALRLRGTLDEKVVRAALNTIVERHESLRTVFVSVDGSPQQEVVNQARFPLKVLDLNGCEEAEREAEVRRQKVEEIHEQFDLRAGPLIRGRLLRISNEEYVLLITMHHIISDGWSMGVFFSEFADLYRAYREGLGNPLEPLPIQYADYAQWQRQWLRGEMLEKQINHWRAHLRDAPPQLELPTDRARPAVQSYRGENVSVVLDAQLSGKLKALAQRHEMTLFMVLYGASAMLLSRLSAQDDVVIGTPVANRQHPNIDGLIGFFVNTLALRVRVQSDMSVREFLEQVKDVTLGGYAHQDVPFEKVVEALQPQRSLSRNPIFQVMLALRNAPKSELQLPGIVVTLEEGIDEPSLFDLLLVFEERESEIVGIVNYAADLFDRATINRWMSCLCVLLKGMTDGVEKQIGELPILSERERRQVIEAFNATEQEYPQEKLIHELFEKQVHRTPGAVAVEHEGQRLTYAALNAKANQLARYLRDQGVGPNHPVGICIERRIEMVIGLLGALKAGAAYVPLDPNYPAERLEYMLEDAAPKVLLTQQSLRGKLPDAQAELIALDVLLEQITGRLGENLSVAELGLNSQNLVYVIYTSGSTGRPKGTAMTHRSMVNLVEWHRHSFSDSEGKRVLQFAALSFDVAFQEIFSTLCTGGTLVLLDEWVRRDARALSEFLSRHGIERLFVPPLMLQSLAEYCQIPSKSPHGLRDVITAGEQLRISPETVQFFKRLPGCRLHNHYGPTETHVVTALTLTGDPAMWPALPAIGQPIANSQLYVLDGRHQAVPIGVTGEIYIGGAGVARGYVRRPELTAQRFLADPFSADPNARLYKTGDLGRWRSNGELEYLGRNDDQVKIRGFRIELGEIEAQLAQHAQVKDASVVAREDEPGEKRLVAYVTPRDANSPSAEDLRTHLKAALPDHMVPSAFVVLKHLPLTPSGKLDRRALPAPGLDAYLSRQYEAPQGEMEETLARIWQELLGLERIGRHDNFFELGGHSLLIVQMMERLRRIKLCADVRSVYMTPTLADLARSLSREVGQFDVPPNLIPFECEAIAPEMLTLIELEPEHIERIAQAVPGGAANIQDIYPLTALQEGMLFHHLLNEQGGDTYVLPILLWLASRQRLEQLIQALQAVIDRHDVLRTAVLWEQLPRPTQIVLRHAVLPVEALALDRHRDSIEQLKERMALEHQRLDLRHAPLMRLQVVEDPHGEQWYALLQVHHFICDKVSLDTMLAEVMAYVDARAHRLPKPVPFRNHVAQALSHARAHDAEAFFRRKLGDIEEPTAPFGLLDVHGDGKRIAEAKQVLDSALAHRLRAQARRLSVSAATLIHAAWGLVVSRTTGRDDIVFGTVLLGRLHGSAGAQRVLGMFINTLPLRISLHEITAQQLVERTQRELAELMHYEQTSLAVAQRCSGIPGSTPLFSTLLNYRLGIPALENEPVETNGVQVLASQGLTNYPITLSVDERGEKFTLTSQTDRSLGPHRMLGYMSAAVHALVEALEQESHTPALALTILPECERHQVIESFAATQATHPPDRMIHELFEAQVQRTPDIVAVEYEGRSLTYGELNAKANQLARYLANQELGPDRLVGIYLERNLEMVVGLLGILKAGAAYVPFDPNYPVERLRYMLEDAAPRLVLTQEDLRVQLPATEAKLILLDAKLKEVSGDVKDNLVLPELGLRTDQLVYVIYTSGSTGQPKGTGMPHRSMVNLIEWHRQNLPARGGRRVLQFAALSFDVAFQETFATLCTGGTLVLLDEWMRRDPRALMEFLSQRSIERLFVPPLMLQSLAEVSKLTGAAPASVQDVICAGEPLRIPPDVARLFERLPGCRLHNHYGPTETHVVTTLTLSGAPSEWPTLPAIGRPIANARIYILDDYRNPVPIGVAGEIYIGGAGVARGYLNRPELTAERFLPDPFSADPQARLYKTGDMGLWQADGILKYLGRNDDQVKIRGFRIELGEIEAQLARHEAVKDAAVVVREDVLGEKRLVAYVTYRGEQEPGIEALRTYVKTFLPEHMVPSAFVLLESLPLTPSGKLNRRALPTPELGSFASEQYEAPQGDTEVSLTQIWQELLHVERIGRHDNFFELGGHSLLAMRLIVQVAERLSVNLAVSAVFRYPTVQQMAEAVEALSLAHRASTTTKGEELEDGVI